MSTSILLNLENVRRVTFFKGDEYKKQVKIVVYYLDDYLFEQTLDYSELHNPNYHIDQYEKLYNDIKDALKRSDKYIELTFN